MPESQILMRWRSGESWFKASLGRKCTRHHLNSKKLGTVVPTCHPSYMGTVNRRITVMASLGIKVSLY
jgi:hypothetical protein